MRTRGTTLVEVMVASALLSLLLLVSAKLFIPAVRAWERQQKETERTQGLLVAINWLEKDLGLAQLGSVSFQDNTVLTLVKSKAQVEGQQNPFRVRVIYTLSEGSLFRFQQEFEPKDKLESLVVPTEKGLPIARNIVRFVIQTPQDWLTEVTIASRVGGRESEIVTAVTSAYAPLDAAIEERVPSSL